MIMLKNVTISDAPWSVHDHTHGSIIDAHGRLVALVPTGPITVSADGSLRVGDTVFPVPRTEGMSPRFHYNNLALISAAPELLAALKEAAYTLEQLGVEPDERFYDLINRATGNSTNISPPHARASSSRANSSTISEDT